MLFEVFTNGSGFAGAAGKMEELLKNKTRKRGGDKIRFILERQVSEENRVRPLSS
jgi:hypothetical protein